MGAIKSFAGIQLPVNLTNNLLPNQMFNTIQINSMIANAIRNQIDEARKENGSIMDVVRQGNERITVTLTNGQMFKIVVTEVK